MATVPQFPSGTLARAALNTFVTEMTTNITDSNIASSATIADSKLSIPTRIKQSQRQGGSATDWNTTGTATQTVTNPIVQTGTITTTAAETFSNPIYYSAITVTFPTAYTSKPHVMACQTGIGATAATNVVVGSISTTQATFTVMSRDSGYVNGAIIAWLAIGT